MLAFLALNAGAVFVALRVALATGAAVRVSRLMLCLLSGYLLVIHSTVLVAGLLGQLTVGGLMVLVAVAVAGAYWFTRPRISARALIDLPCRFTQATLFVPVLAIGAGVAWTWPHLFEATRLWIWDDYVYHMVYPANWLRQQAIAAVTPAQAFTMQAWYPLSGSVVATWFMAPFHPSRGESLAWVSLTAMLYAGIVATAAAELLARVGCRGGAWAVPVALFATSQRVTVMGSSFSDADLALAAALFGACAFAIPGAVSESRRDVTVDACYAGLLTGFAAGIKPSAAPYAVILLLVMTLRASALETMWRALARVGLIFAVAWLGTTGYWYLRNLIHTGNPVYPAAFLIWPGTTFPETTLREYGRQYGLGRAVRDALAVYAHWPPWHAALAILGLMGLAGSLVARRPTLTRSQAYFAATTFALALVMLMLVPVLPYSAGNAMTFRSGFIHWDSMRYIALLLILGWVALGFVLDAGAGAGHAPTVVAIVIATASVLVGHPQSAAVVILAGAVLGAAVGPAILRRAGAWRARRRILPAVATASTIVVSGILMWGHGPKAGATAAAVYREPLFGAAAAVLDRLPAGTRVAVFGDQWVYPTFGAHDHLLPLRLDDDGRIATTPIGDAMTQGPLTVAPSTFRTNLATSGVDVVAVVHMPHPGRSPAWPNQADALETIGDVHLLHRDGAVAIWRLDRFREPLSSARRPHGPPGTSAQHGYP